MSKRYYRRLSALFIVLTIASITLLGSLFPASANGPGISYIYQTRLDCSGFLYVAFGTPGGFAAVRIWAGQAGQGTPLVDSFTAGYPSSYTALDSGGEAVGKFVSFPAQPSGTTITARVYRALSAVPGSWDHQAYQDWTTTCQAGISHPTVHYVNCSSFDINVTAWPASGFAALRVWSNNIPIVDSYNPGHPTNYKGIDGSGSIDFAASFPPQPAGASLEIDIYRALAATTGSWDNQSIFDTKFTCQGGITPTPPGK